MDMWYWITVANSTFVQDAIIPTRMAITTSLEVFFTAIRVSLSSWRWWSAGMGGITLTSEPVSTRNHVCVLVSLTWKRQLKCWAETPVITNIWPGCFPNYRAPCISMLLPQTLHGTSRGCHQVEEFLEQDSIVDRCERSFSVGIWVCHGSVM